MILSNKKIVGKLLEAHDLRIYVFFITIQLTTIYFCRVEYEGNI